MRVRFGAVVAGICVVAAACVGEPKSNVRPLGPGSPAEQYLAEFLELERVYPRGEREGARSPTGSFTVTLDHEEGFLRDNSCHSVWLNAPEIPRLRILRVRESDPGSGSSFGFGWSHDGRAIFLSGSHSGIDCPSERKGDALRIIYIVEDGVAWEVPARPSNSAVNPPHSVVTALAQGSERRAAGRAGHRGRWAERNRACQCDFEGDQP